MTTSRSRPVTVSARVTIMEKGLVQAAAAAGGLPVAEFIHGLVVTEAERIVARSLGPSGSDEPLAPTEPAQ